MGKLAMVSAAACLHIGCALPSDMSVVRSVVGTTPVGGSTATATAPVLADRARTGQGSRGRGAAKREFVEVFQASGARLRFAPRRGRGYPWGAAQQALYLQFKTDPRAGYAVQNLDTGIYLAEWNADEAKYGGSMPKPALSMCLLEAKRGMLSQRQFQDIVNVCDLSINESWKRLAADVGATDHAALFARYGLPAAGVDVHWGNKQSPRFYCEFFRKAVNYEFEFGCELLLEAMRRAQFGRGDTYLPAEITYLGGKTGTYGEFKHQGLFFYCRGTPYAIVVYTKGHFTSGDGGAKIGILMGGLFEEFVR